MNDMLMGGIAVASFMAGLYFLRFWRNTRDRFFLYFALSFLIEGANRLMLGLVSGSESEPFFYLLRVVAYGLIVLAILGKNRKAP